MDKLKPRERQGVLTLHPYCRLEWDVKNQTHSLIFPSGMVRLPTRYGTLLRLCDGSRRMTDILTITCDECGGCIDELESFLVNAIYKGWLITEKC